MCFAMIILLGVSFVKNNEYNQEKVFFFSSRRRHTRSKRDWSSDVCSSDLDDHAGHGRTAMQSGIWADAGDDAARVVVSDELTLQRKVREILPDLRCVVFGHS